uniref:IF rod domain-containing protein n=1 Tax=Labrus bergylta TaxID=56723 RepID=A0A3Q3EK72_9LABR
MNPVLGRAVFWHRSSTGLLPGGPRRVWPMGGPAGPGGPPPSGLAYLHLNGPLHRVPPAATALRNDLGSNISVLKTLNLRFRAFFSKVHELERRNKVLEKQLQQAVEENGGEGTRSRRPKTWGPDWIYWVYPAQPGLLPSTTLQLQPHPLRVLHQPGAESLRPQPEHHQHQREVLKQWTNTPLPSPPTLPPRTIWSFNHTRRFGSGRESCVTGPGVSWTHPDGSGERDEYKKGKSALPSCRAASITFHLDKSISHIYLLKVYLHYL